MAGGMTLQTKRFYAFGPFRLDAEKRVLVRDGAPVLLAPKTAEVLFVLVQNAGCLVEKDDLMKRVWPNAFVEEGNLNKNISLLRKILGVWDGAREYIETVPKRGYRFVAPVNEVTHAEGSPQPQTSTGSNLIGKKVSHYRVLEVIGGGGMGLVYKAEDLKLGRRVALKFLPEEVGDDPVTLERFEREARTASSLNHPNICTIYEFGEHEGQPFLVMELLEGETLREVISKAQVSASGGRAQQPLKKLVDIALQIATGLDAAHQKGIIHRDIKPANIFVTAHGQVKILDFGLAKMMQLGVGVENPHPANGRPDGAPAAVEAPDFSPANADAEETGLQPRRGLKPDLDDASERRAEARLFHQPTAASLTLTGTAMGTAGYMSPEQVRGEKLDARTDLFSFGLILYEMATGQRAFGGETAAILKDAILNHTRAPVHSLNSTLPPKLEQIISSALQKDREQRYQTAAEMRSDLEAAAADSSVHSVKDLKTSRTRQFFTFSAAALLVLLCLAVVVLITRRQPIRPQLKQTQLTENSSENEVEGGAISPDGKYLAYADVRGMHLKLLETGETRNIQEPEELKRFQPDWGPFSLSATKFLAVASILGRDDSTWSVPVMGGALHKLHDNAFLPSVSPDGSTIAFLANQRTNGSREIWLMDSNGEHARKVYETEEKSNFGLPNWSPDGQRLLYLKDHRNGDKVEITLESRDLNGGPVTTVLSDARLWTYNWLPDGRIIYSLNEADISGTRCNFWQVLVDPRTGKPQGNPNQLTNWAGFCIGGSTTTSDGKRIVFNKWWVQQIVYRADFAPKQPGAVNPRRLTLSDGREHPVGWTADGKSIVFVSNRGGVWGIFKQEPGEESAEAIVTGLTDKVEARLSPNGVWILYEEFPNLASGRLMRVPVAGGPPQVVLSLATPPEPTTSWGVVPYNPPRCARSPAQLCAISERTPDNKQLIFTSFDPMNGRGHELTRFDIESHSSYKWDLSPDGTRIAVLKRSEDRIRILSLMGEPARQVTVKGWKSLQTVDWTADGKGLFVSSALKGSSVLLYSDLQGKANVMWQQAGEQEGSLDIYAIPSPDGRQVAMFGWTLNSNMWMLENF